MDKARNRTKLSLAPRVEREFRLVARKQEDLRENNTLQPTPLTAAFGTVVPPVVDGLNNKCIPDPYNVPLVLISLCHFRLQRFV